MAGIGHERRMRWLRRFMKRYWEDRRYRFLRAMAWGVSVLLAEALIFR